MTLFILRNPPAKMKAEVARHGWELTSNHFVCEKLGPFHSKFLLQELLTMRHELESGHVMMVLSTATGCEFYTEGWGATPLPAFPVSVLRSVIKG